MSEQLLARLLGLHAFDGSPLAVDMLIRRAIDLAQTLVDEVVAPRQNWEVVGDLAAEVRQLAVKASESGALE